MYNKNNNNSSNNSNNSENKRSSYKKHDFKSNGSNFRNGNSNFGRSRFGDNRKSDFNNKGKSNFEGHKKQNDQLDKVNEELKKVKENFEQLTAKFNNLQLENLNLKNEIEKNNQDFINKIAAKSIEANELVAKKQQDLENRFSEDLQVKFANYFEKKLNPLLDSINQFNRIISVDVSNQEVKNYLVGFQMISELFDRSLNDMDVNKITINVGDEFNEEFMTAFEVVQDSDLKPNAVVDIISPAYKFQDKVIKYALVKVQK